MTYKWTGNSALEYNNGKKWLTREARLRSSDFATHSYELE
jgi:hypothetical protein